MLYSRFTCIGFTFLWEIYYIHKILFLCLFKAYFSSRYKDDVYDRIWWPISYYRWTELNTNLDIKQFNDYQMPSSVMTTTATPIIANQCHFYMDFAEVEKLQANQSRVINISLNGNQWYGPFSPKYLSTTTI